VIICLCDFFTLIIWHAIKCRWNLATWLYVMLPNQSLVIPLLFRRWKVCHAVHITFILSITDAIGKPDQSQTLIMPQITRFVTVGSKYLGSSCTAIIRSAFSVRILCRRSRIYLAAVNSCIRRTMHHIHWYPYNQEQSLRSIIAPHLIYRSISAWLTMSTENPKTITTLGV
jgi:hypothetical protein